MSLRKTLSAAAVALLLVACGGGQDTATLRVVGDSLNDSGTFGYKFTVQSSPTTATQIWIDRVASYVGAQPVCPRYNASLALNTAATQCTSYAVGGAKINPPGTSQETSPISIVQQLTAASAAGRYDAEELLFVDGGGNDAADLVGAYLRASSDGGAAYVALLSELLTPEQVNAAVTGGQTALAAAGGQYMTELANRLADAVTTHALNRGAQRVVLLNAPDVTRTPRFLAVLEGVALQTNQATADAVRDLARTWVQAFNGQLNARFAGNNRVAVVNFYGTLNQWLDAPATYGLTNTTHPACPGTVPPGGGLPTYTINACTATLLSATTPPMGATGGASWWQTYVFSDNFHGTPRTNQLMGDLVNGVLASRGWD